MFCETKPNFRLGLLSIYLFALTQSFAFAQGARFPGFVKANGQRQQDVERVFLELPSSDRFRQHLKEITKAPHIAGSPENHLVAEYIASVMRKAGMQVRFFEYDVFLPPDPGEPEVEILSPVRKKLNIREAALAEDPFSADPRLKPGWNAFSGSGEVAANVVYANYGRKEDFEQLAKWDIPVEGKIVLARYGGNFRGFKAKYAQAAGAAGLVIFNDPGEGYRSDNAYPNGFDMNGSTIQRGSLLTLSYTGDPLTPFQPALPLDGPIKIDRLPPDSVAFHKIPVTPIPFDSALEILRRMKGKEAPEPWQGGLDTAYRLLGGEGFKLRLKVAQPYKMVRIANVVGTFAGVRFPDEWVLLGSHYDAWGHGAVDPNGGTAMLLTLAESLGELIGKGYRPGRTIKIAHFDAEEYGIIGSAEWVEQFKDDLDRRAVAYINADAAVVGGRFSASASPTLKELILSASKDVRYPGRDESLYENWQSRLGAATAVPQLGNLGGGSDHVGFYTFLGIPSAGISMGGRAPVYHSNYDNFAWYSKYGDTEFVYGPALAKVDGLVTLRLANADVLPYAVTRYASDLTGHVQDLEERTRALGKPHRFDRLRSQIRTLGAVSNQLAVRLEQVDHWESRRLQKINQRLMALERQWLNGKAIVYSNWNRSLYASPDPFSGYASWMLPGLRYHMESGHWEEMDGAEMDLISAIKDIMAKMNQILRILVEEK